MENIVLKVDGMSCEHCVRAVTNAVANIAGTADVIVDLKAGTVSFSFDSGKTTLVLCLIQTAERKYDTMRHESTKAKLNPRR